MSAAGWIPASEPPAAEGDQPVAVLAVIDDPRLRLNADDEPFVDVANWWPRRGVWTVTHCCRADVGVQDFAVRVRCWQPIPALPSPGSPLWR